MSTMWAIQRADEQWLAMDCGWTACLEEAMFFESRDEAEVQANRMVTNGTAWHIVAAPHVHDSLPS